MFLDIVLTVLEYWMPAKMKFQHGADFAINIGCRMSGTSNNPVGAQHVTDRLYPIAGLFADAFSRHKVGR
jgi:hypothetical protein